METTMSTSTNQLRILKKAKCPSTSGKSTLTYHIGVNDEGDVFFRIAENNGGGFFSAEWVALEDIQQALDKSPDNITSVALYGLFKGKSVNTPSFLLAVLKHEKVIQRVKGRTRKHELGDPGDFQDRVTKLMSGESKPKSTRKKAAVKKKATSRRRATR
jgi:hypothetical protein